MTKAPKKKAATKPGAKAPQTAKTNSKANKATESEAPAAASAPVSEEEMIKRIQALRSQVREGFGKVVMAMMAQSRYKHHTLADLQHLVLEPLTLDRIAIAYGRTATAEVGAPDIAGMAIWANVTEETDLKIREQIQAGTFPIRLRSDEWTGGKINWLLDVIAVDQKTAGQVIGNFRQVIKDGDLRMHPIITRLVDKETLEKLKQAAVPADA